MFSSGDSVAIIFLSFRASEARHGIQYFQHVLDAGFHRHDDVDGFFTIATQPPRAEVACFSGPEVDDGGWLMVNSSRLLFMASTGK
ncbi:MAG: hypothetical protein KBG13_08865 [Syntrophaceae bacterium]|nr:hypothetical protein [Syntrophaceae bacterium]